MNPASVLLDNVTIELMGCEFQTFPPGIEGGEPPGSNSSYSNPSEVLVELSFIDLSDPESAYRNQTSHNFGGVV